MSQINKRKHSTVRTLYKTNIKIMTIPLMISVYVGSYTTCIFKRNNRVHIL